MSGIIFIASCFLDGEQRGPERRGRAEPGAGVPPVADSGRAWWWLRTPALPSCRGSDRFAGAPRGGHKAHHLAQRISNLPAALQVRTARPRSPAASTPPPALPGWPLGVAPPAPTGGAACLQSRCSRPALDPRPLRPCCPVPSSLIPQVPAHTASGTGALSPSSCSGLGSTMQLFCGLSLSWVLFLRPRQGLCVREEDHREKCVPSRGAHGRHARGPSP